ncbi:hypothetical protein BDA96_10G009700 [Sorghum bicolor]|uniref:Uncharacterized protein n=1 Tax=Sorghum bicolor TaxID=4558 RepID=A0A921TZ61_SORBI|nr:hypothetical protein BDA96_10G009700 [Sorghum bicolor]
MAMIVCWICGTQLPSLAETSFSMPFIPIRMYQDNDYFVFFSFCFPIYRE